MGVLTPGGRLTRRGRCPTTIRDLRAKVLQVRGRREIVLEEGPLADWIARGLAPVAERVTVCDPRRNHLIAKDSDKDDPIDAEKLPRLYRGGYVKAVHHPETFDRVVFKRHVGLYHDAVRERVRRANRMIAELRQYGVFVKESAFAELAEIEARRRLWERLPSHPLVRADVGRLWELYDGAATHVQGMRRSLIQHARQEPQIVRFTAVPGVKWVRASTFFAYVDTPWRFPSKQALWKYLGVGLERRRRGGGRERLRVPWGVNRGLKNAIPPPGPLDLGESMICSRRSRSSPPLPPKEVGHPSARCYVFPACSIHSARVSLGTASGLSASSLGRSFREDSPKTPRKRVVVP